MFRLLILLMLLAASTSGFSQSQEALERQLERASSTAEKVAVLNELAFSLHNRYPRQTLQRSQAAIQLIESADSPMELAKSVAYKNMGLAYWRLANYDSSLHQLNIASSIADEIESDSLKAKIVSNLGLVYREKGEYSRSLKNSFQAYRVFQEMGDKANEAVVANNIGVVYGMMENHREALNYFQHSIAIGRAIQNEMIICGNLNFLGETFYHLDNVESGLSYLEKAIIYCRAVRNNVYLSRALFNKASILAGFGQYPEAIATLEEALAIQQEIGDLKGQAESHNTLGELFMQLNDAEAASRNLESAYGISSDNKLIAPLQQYYFLKIRLDSLNEDFVAAQQDLILYKNLTDSIYHLKGFAEISDIILRYESENLEIERRLQAEAIKGQQAKTRFIYVLLGSALTIIVILGFLIRSKSLTNRKLRRLNLQIIEQKEEIDERSEELKTSNTELQNTVDQLMETQKQLVESEKMASLGQLAAGIGHEINNPLNFIKGGVMALRQELEGEKRPVENGIGHCFDVIDEGVKRAAEIVKSLSHFSRLDQSMQDECDIHEILDHCLVILHSRLRDRIQIKKSYHPAKVRIKGNEGRLHQAFLNIISNADQAISGKGEIAIETTLRQQKLVVSISDTGEGIDESKIKQVMEPFFTTKPPGQGTGLGLSITYNIITEHQGTISMSSKPKEGCTVKVQFPALSAQGVPE